MRRPRISPRIVAGLELVSTEWELLFAINPTTGEVAETLSVLSSEQRDSVRRAQKYVEKLSLWYNQEGATHED